MGIKGVIFDVDGTLVDSDDAHNRAWVDALAQHGYNCSWLKGAVSIYDDPADLLAHLDDWPTAAS